MENPAIRNLLSFIQQDLDPAAHGEELDDYSHIICPTLPFDIFIYKEFTERPGVSESRYILISLGQLEQEGTKIKNRLKVLAGKAKKLHARSTVAARLDKKQSLSFLQEHHLQVPLPGKYRYGLFYEGELVSIAVFSGGRRMKDRSEDYRSFELLRFCHKSDHLIIGGLSKLIRAFIKDFHPGDIMTYVDQDWSQDSSLKTIGFQEMGSREGANFWIADQQQYLIKSEEHLLEMTENHPNGYLSQNSGSIKLVLAV
ncbi:hypothetical protein [Sphingobacterium mizutaii]|uniref:hypothetical protein n=1 Tax=Sphingobacterium mizutaii TaxID=1010 RepID=UPI0028ADE5B1|nr:hypothetical protein [Sphingobacterium mizutaii]